MKKTSQIYLDSSQKNVSFSISSRHLVYCSLIFISVLIGVLSIYVDAVFIIVSLLSILFSILCINRPKIGLVLFVILSLIRPADTFPILAAIPLAKLIGGLTLISIILKYIMTKEIVLGSRQMLLLLVFSSTLFISVPFSFWPSASLEVALDFLKILLFYFIFVNVVKELSFLRTVSLVALACIIILCLSTIYAYSIGSETRAASIIGSGTFGDANDLALILVVGMPLAGFLKLGWKPGLIRNALHWGIILLLIAGIVTTGSRGGLLGLIAILSIYIFTGRSKIPGIMMLILIAILFFIFVPSDLNERYSSISHYEEDASAMGRINAWKAGLKMMATRPLNGVGAGCFGMAYGTAYQPGGGQGRWTAPHNTLIQVGGETGLIGLAAFLYLYFFCLIRLKNLNPPLQTQAGVKILETKNIIIASLIGFGICAFFLTQAFNYMYYFLVASTFSLENINARLQEKTEYMPVNQGT